METETKELNNPTEEELPSVSDEIQNEVDVEKEFIIPVSKKQYNDGHGTWFRKLQMIFMPGVAFCVWLPIIYLIGPLREMTFDRIPDVIKTILYVYMAIAFVAYAIISFVKVKAREKLERNELIFDKAGKYLTYKEYDDENKEYSIYTVNEIHFADYRKRYVVLKGEFKKCSYNLQGDLLFEETVKEFKFPNAYQTSLLYSVLDSLQSEAI